MAATLVLRTVKGSPLTNYEVDNNFSNLNTFGSLVDSNIGVLTNLTTTAKGNIVVAINENVTAYNLANTKIGVLNNLTTSEKSNLVAAINEIVSESTTAVGITGGTISGVVVSNTILSTNTDWQGNVISITYGGTGSSSASSARTSLGLAIGSNVQAWSANLDTIASLSRASGNFIVGNGSAWTVQSTSTARTTLGLGTLSTQDSNSVNITGGSISGTSISTSSVTITGGTVTGLTNLTGSNATFTGNVNCADISATGYITATDFNSTSDIVMKENIFDITDPFTVLQQLQPKEFTWKSTGNKSYGLIAQDVEKILPSIVANNNGVKGINYINIIAFLIEAVKELSAEVKQIKNK